MRYFTVYTLGDLRRDMLVAILCSNSSSYCCLIAGWCRPLNVADAKLRKRLVAAQQTDDCRHRLV